MSPDDRKSEEEPEPELGDTPKTKQRRVDKSGSEAGDVFFEQRYWRQSYGGSDEPGEHGEKGGREPETDLGDAVVKHTKNTGKEDG